jgi:hypothetical protein
VPVRAPFPGSEPVCLDVKIHDVVTSDNDRLGRGGVPRDARGGVRTISGSGDDHLCVDTDPARMYAGDGGDVLVATTAAAAAGSRRRRRRPPGVLLPQARGTTCSDSGLVDADTMIGGDGQDFAMVNRGDIVFGPRPSSGGDAREARAGVRI